MPEPAGSGGRAEPAGSGGRAEPAGSGGRAEPAGSGGRAEPAGSGGRAQPAGRGASGPLLLRGGTVVDRDGVRRADVLVADGAVAAVGEGLDGGDAAVVDCDGCWVGPGLVDLHTHLRQPGREEAETVETGSRAAALGGFTTVVAMPNTTPPIDSAGVVREVLALGAKALCRVEVSGAITVGRDGERLAPMAELVELGVRLFTDDGNGVQDGRLMRRAMEYSLPLRVVLAQHCEDDVLAAKGVMHEGAWSSRMGVPGQPAEAEEVMVMRDLALARLTGARVHFQHLSTRRSVEMVRQAKTSGLPVTCEATPHHLTLTDEACAGYDTVFRVNPPLRPADDRDAVRAGLLDGTIDAVATDHAPHDQEAKEQPFDQAPPGMLGLETALALVLGQLGLAEDPQRLFALMSWQPAGVLGLAGAAGRVAEGAPADLCVVDPAERWVVDPARLASRSRNTPYAGMTLDGRVRHTVCRGEAVVVDQEAQR